MTAGAHTCRDCGAALNPNETRGLCPACLFRISLRTDEEPEVNEAVDAAWLERNQLAAPPEPGEKSHRLGDYELFEEIGRGGMGVIYRARQVSLDRFVAIKTILTGPLASADFTQRFQTEAHAAAVLDHPHIVPIYEVGNHRGQPFYSMRLLVGRNLAQELKETGPMPVRRAAALVATVARAVHYAHQRGVLHRDLKPANILMDADGTPHVTDFGLAKLLEQDDGLTLTQAALGTPNYMSPEQAAGNASELTMAADVYSLGAILFEVLTARKLFSAATPLATINRAREQEPPKPSAILSTIPRDLDTICWKCLEKEPNRRYASALVLAEDLEHWLAGEPIRARHVGAVERLGLWCRRKPALAGMAGAALVALLIVSAVALWRVRAARHQEDLERYAANISLADSAIKAGSVNLAMDYLMKCPEPQRHWEWGRLLFECLQEVCSIPAHTNRPQFLNRPLLEYIAFNRQGTRLSSRGLDGTLAVWDPIEGRQFFRIGDATNQMSASSFRPDRNEIAVGKIDGSVEILDSDTGRSVARMITAQVGGTNQSADPIIWINLDVYDPSPIRDPMRPRPWAVVGLDWDPLGRRMVIVRADGRVDFRDLEGAVPAWKWTPSGTLPSHAGFIAEVGVVVICRAWFASDGQSVVIQSPGLAQRMEASTGREVATLRWDPSTEARVGAWVSPAGDRVALIDSERRVRLRDAHGLVADLGRLAQRSLHAPLAVFFSPDGSLFCTTGDVGTARVFRADTGEVLFALPGTVYGGAFSAEGDQLAVFGLDRVLHVWDVHHRSEARPLRGHLSTLTSVAYAPGARLLATASREGMVKTWSAGHHGRVFFSDAPVMSSGYSPDGRWLATAPSFRGLRLWEAATGRLKWKLPSRTQSISTPVFSHDGQLLYAPGSDPCVRIHQVADGRMVGMLRGHQRPIWTLHCSPDGRHVASGDRGGMLKIWDAQTRTERHSIAAHPAAIWSLFFDAQSRFIISAGTGKARVWEVSTGRMVVELDDDGGGAWYVAFSPDGRHVVSACLDNQIRVWEIPSGRLVASWTSQTQGASYGSYTPDGLRFAVPVADMSTLGFSMPRLEIWDAQHGRPLLDLEAHRDSIYSALFDLSGRRLLTASMDTTVRQWEAFPWREADYPEPKGAPLAERVRHFARHYWGEHVAQSDDTSGAVRISEEPPLSPGIPEWERERWPPRDPTMGPLQINLDRYYTGVLDAIFYPSWNDPEYDDDLASLPTGLQKFGGVLFDVRGVIWLRWELPQPIDPAFQATCHDFPERIEGIAIGRKFQKLQVLHAASTSGLLQSPIQMNGQISFHVIGSYVLRYADGTRHEHEIKYGRDLRNWWWGGRGDAAPEAERATVAWVGTNSASSRYEAKVRLFQSVFENPRPDVEVVSVDFISKQTPFAPFLVAMTIEP